MINQTMKESGLIVIRNDKQKDDEPFGDILLRSKVSQLLAWLRNQGSRTR